MPKKNTKLVEIILSTYNNSKFGKIIKVKPGLARNYLIPQNKAIYLHSKSQEEIDVIRQHHVRELKRQQEEITRIRSNLTNRKITIVSTHDANSTNLYRAITKLEIVTALQQQCAVSLSEDKIMLDHPIKSLGEHTVKCNVKSLEDLVIKLIVKSS